MGVCSISAFSSLSCGKSKRCAIIRFCCKRLLTVFKSSASRDELQAVFSKYTKSNTDAEDANPPSMSLEAFNSFLLSPDNAVFSDQHRQVHHDMTLPLSEYYISSSHNTYLVGHQLVGDSTIEGYIRALLHSCRSVEGTFNPNSHRRGIDLISSQWTSTMGTSNL